MTRSTPLLLALLSLPLLGCPPTEPTDEPMGVTLLGGGSNDIGELDLDRIGTRDDGLDVPRDLAFDPENPDRLWVINSGDHTATIFMNAGTDQQESDHRVDPYGFHFMENSSSMAFGAPGFWASCQESRNTYGGRAPADDQMGPSLWSSDLDVFAYSNPEAVAFLTELLGYPADLGSHLDMLHSSPDCMGITWERDNVYWVFDGFNGAIVRNDFAEDHGPGFDDHSDGIIGRYIEGEVERVEGVPSHMVFDHDTELIYFVDTGNNRIGVLDSTTGTRGDSLPSSGYDQFGTDHYRMDGAESWTLIEGADFGLEEPSGLEKQGEVLYVSDHATGIIHAFSLQGEHLDWVDTGRGEGLMGMALQGDEALWFVHAEEDRVYRMTPR